MQATPNTTMTIREPVQIDTFSGQPAGGNTVIAEGVPTYLIERPATRPRTGAEGRAVQDPASDTPRQVRVFSARMPAGTPVKRTHQLTEDSTERQFTIKFVRSHRFAHPAADVILELTAVDDEDP